MQTQKECKKVSYSIIEFNLTNFNDRILNIRIFNFTNRQLIKITFNNVDSANDFTKKFFQKKNELNSKCFNKLYLIKDGTIRGKKNLKLIYAEIEIKNKDYSDKFKTKFIYNIPRIVDC